MRYFIKILILFLFVCNLTYSQTRIDIADGNRLKWNAIEIEFSENKILFFRAPEIIFEEFITGKKQIFFSPAENFLLIVNYGFKKTKDDYEINYFIFNAMGSLEQSGSITEHFDLPHHLFAINNNGIVAAFSPAKFSLRIISKEIKTEIILSEEKKFLYERATKILMSESEIFVLTSDGNFDIEKFKPNVELYKIGINNFKIENQILELSNFTSFELFDELIFISGFKIDNKIFTPTTFLYNSQLQLKNKSNEFALENVIKIEESFIGSFGNKIFLFNEDLQKLNNALISEAKSVKSLNNLGKTIFITIVTEKKDRLVELGTPFLFGIFNVSPILGEADFFNLLKFQNKLYIFNKSKTVTIE